MDKLVLFALMRDIVLAVTGVPSCILANQNKPSPNGEYCAIHIDGPKRQRGQANIIDKNTDAQPSPIGNVFNVNTEVRAQVNADITLNFYRGDANLYATSMYQANKLPSISAMLYAANVGWQGSNAVNDLTALQSNQQEPRAQLVIRVMYEQVVDEVVNSIYGVLTEVQNEDGDIIIEDFTQAPTEP